MSHNDEFNKNRALYNTWSKFYDTYPNPTVAIDELSFPQKYAHLTGKKVLEVGCGTGRHTVRLVDQANEVIGIDISEGMISEARKKLEGRAFTAIHGDFMQIDGLEPDMFDAIVMSLVLEHLDDLTQFFKRVGFVLKPSGEIWISEIHPARSSAGVLAHFKDPSTEEDLHLFSRSHAEADVLSAADAQGLDLISSEDVMGAAELERIQSKWSRHLGQPMLKIWGFRKRNL